MRDPKPCVVAARALRLAERAEGRLAAPEGEPNKEGGTQRSEGSVRMRAAAERRKAASWHGGGEPMRARATA